MDEAGASLKPKSIDVNKAGDDATVSPLIVHPHGTKKGDDQRWVKRKGDWYLFIDP